MSATQPTFDHTGLSAADLDAALKWWTSALDMEVEVDFEIPGCVMRGAMLKSPAGYRIELLHRPASVEGLQATHPLEAALTRGYGHVAFDVPDVDVTYQALIAAGASDRLGPRHSPEPGVRMAFVAHPEGNLIELVDRDAAKAAGRHGIVAGPHDPGGA